MYVEVYRNDDGQIECEGKALSVYAGRIEHYVTWERGPQSSACYPTDEYNLSIRPT